MPKDITVSPTVAASLRSEALYARAAVVGASRGREVKVISPFVTRAAGLVEAGRVASLLVAPLVRDRVTVPGARRDLVGKSVRLSSGPAAGAVVRVLGAEEGNSETVLRVLRRLG